MGIDSVNFPNNSFGFNGKESDGITQKNDTIKNVLNPENKIVSDDTKETKKTAQKEKSETEKDGTKLSFKDRWQNFKGKLHKIFHKEKTEQKEAIHPAEK